ncbi:MAG: hypothetical protein U0487_03980 [Patescibacteria group bacterium]
MAEPALNPQSSAARKLRGASPVRVVGNLPQARTADTERARSFMRDRQRPVLQTLTNPALQAPTEPEDEETLPDEYGAQQRESEARMREINRGDESDEETEGETEAGQDLGPDDYEQAVGDGLDQERREQQRALALRRQRAAQQAYAQQLGLEANEEEVEEQERQNAAQQRAQIKNAKTLIKLIEGVTIVGILLLIVQLNYELLFEKDDPTWKKFATVLMDIGLLFAALAPLIMFVLVFMGAFAVGREFLPEAVRGLFDSIVSSVL